jgi:hypothetical protein
MNKLITNEALTKLQATRRVHCFTIHDSKMKPSKIVKLICVLWSLVQGQMFKRVILPGNYWPTKIEKTSYAKTNTECAAMCTSVTVSSYTTAIQQSFSRDFLTGCIGVSLSTTLTVF